ncbi:hypothetical protein MA16_Dca021080 [Dendrobium catenatum]|uniref:Uncharacterized protein n=1 Tax=Dendrobium catenatum TaxID=906689 RepID=A0A2I0VXW2_9ASPA|nr:hypothetical protein MA16_Dca021080 [Dendrobium catenatum]
MGRDGGGAGDAGCTEVRRLAVAGPCGQVSPKVRSQEMPARAGARGLRRSGAGADRRHRVVTRADCGRHARGEVARRIRTRTTRQAT